MERASFLRLVCYLCPKLTEADIPKRTCMGDSILEKVERLDDIDLNIINVSHFYHISNISSSLFNFLEHCLPYFAHFRRVDNKAAAPLYINKHPVHRLATGRPLLLDFKKSPSCIRKQCWSAHWHLDGTGARECHSKVQFRR